MGFLSCTRRDINQVCTCNLKIKCGARPLTRRGEQGGFHLEIESSEPLDEKTAGIGDFFLQYFSVYYSMYFGYIFR